MVGEVIEFTGGQTFEWLTCTRRPGANPRISRLGLKDSCRSQGENQKRGNLPAMHEEKSPNSAIYPSWYSGRQPMLSIVKKAPGTIPYRTSRRSAS